VRALRHYDDIELLVPSERSSGGYRLYGQKDVARLYRIQALRRLDLSLAEIQGLLDNAAAGISEVVALQVAQLDREIQQASALRTHLLTVQSQLQVSEEPGVDWLLALENMVVGSKYLSDDEQLRLNTRRESFADAAAPERAELTAWLLRLVSAGVSPENPEAQTLAQRWIALLLEEAGGDEGLLMKLYTMHWNEPSLRALTGVGRSGIRYISHAMAFARLQRYAPYCSADEMATLRLHYVAQTDAWPPLIAEARQLMLANAPPVAQPCARWRCVGRHCRLPRPAATPRCTRSCNTHSSTLLCGPVRASTRHWRPMSGKPSPMWIAHRPPA
jgi:DNA-binding transcriptional MerR regulator